jgi:hypothetical protein
MNKQIGKWMMIVGALVFLATPLLLYLWNFDSDILGVLIFLVGLFVWWWNR